MQVSVGPSGVWAVNTSHQIFYRVGTYGDVDSDGVGWIKVDGALKWVSSSDGCVFGVNGRDQIFQRKGITASRPTGNNWVRLEHNEYCI